MRTWTSDPLRRIQVLLYRAPSRHQHLGREPSLLARNHDLDVRFMVHKRARVDGLMLDLAPRRGMAASSLSSGRKQQAVPSSHRIPPGRVPPVQQTELVHKFRFWSCEARAQLGGMLRFSYDGDVGSGRRKQPRRFMPPLSAQRGAGFACAACSHSADTNPEESRVQTRDVSSDAHRAHRATASASCQHTGAACAPCKEKFSFRPASRICVPPSLASNRLSGWTSVATLDTSSARRLPYALRLREATHDGGPLTNH